MKKPSGKDIFALLVSLYADQNGVTVTYELEEKKEGQIDEEI